MQQIQDLLPDDQTAIVEWYILSETFLTFVITSQNVSYWSSSPEDQKNLIELTNKYLSSYRSEKSQWQGGLGTFLSELARILHLDQILAQIPAHYNQLILIPHRVLHLLPLHALPLPDDKDKCLLDKFETGVRYAPSCQLLQLCQGQQRNDFSHFFAIQNPTQDLSYTDIEVASIRRNFQPNDDVLPRQEAKKEAITHQRVRNTHCAHFSCHGYFNFKSPLQSALLLADSVVSPAPAAPDPNRYLSLRDGAALDLKKCLTLGDLFDRVLDLKHCRLVTLSACETGMTDFASLSDEYVGLPSGFLFAGSPSVVSSLWAVNDLSTAFLMIKFYENLQTDHASVAVALNQAQCWLRSATQEHLLGWIKIKGLSEPFHQQIQNTLDWFNPDEKPFLEPYHSAAFCAIGQ